MKDKYELVKGECKDCCFSESGGTCRLVVNKSLREKLEKEVGDCSDKEHFDHHYKLKEDK